MQPCSRLFTSAHIAYKNYFFHAYAFLIILLWYAVAETDSGFYIGYRSVFDTKIEMKLQYFPRNEYLLNTISNHSELQNLKRFSKGFYTASLQQDTLVFNDLRFGQVAGWQQANAPFVFHYYLQHSDNSLVVQRGRFEGWNKKSLAALWEKIKGN